MSDLTAANCGCGNSSTFSNGSGCNIIWIILLLSCFCGGNGSCGGFGNILGGNGCGNSCDNGCGNNSCEWLIWILLISCLCGGNNDGCGSRCC